MFFNSTPVHAALYLDDRLRAYLMNSVLCGRY
jgi:hypothetical protein